MYLSTIAVVAQCILAAFVARVIYLCYFHPLARYPGPFLARFTNLWRLFTFLGGQHHLSEQHLHEKYGHVVRVAPNWLSFSGIQDFDAIYGFNKSVEKDDFYTFGRGNANRVPSIFSTKTDADHRQKKRKVLGPALTSAKVARYEPVVAKHVNILLSRIETESTLRRVDKTTTVNMAPLVHRFTTDAMLELIYGPEVVSHPYTDSATGGEMCSTLRKMSKMAWSFSLCPTYGRSINSRPISALLRKVANKKGDLMALTALMASSHVLIFRRREVSEPEQPGIVHSWLGVPPNDPNRMTQDEVFSEATNLVFAGPGSMAAALTATVYQLGTEAGQKWQEKLRKQTDVSLELQAVIKESLRHRAAFPTAFPRVITPGAETVVSSLSTPLPVGTTVSANTYVLGRSREIWGDTADQWLPQRWLGDESQRREMEAKLVAFSKGPRGCVGKDLAWLVLAKACDIMSTPGALPQTLRSITDIKISELSKQRSLFQKQREQILKAAANAPDLRSKAQVLLEGVTKLNGYANDAFDREDLDTYPEEPETTVENGTARAAHVNIRRFLLQSQYDPSVSDRSLKGWVAQLEDEVKVLQLRHEHASFYSSLVTEWLANLESEGDSAAATEEQGAGLEPVGRAEMHEQRATWEQYVFHEASVDEKTINAYLDQLFTKTNLSQQALKDLRLKIKTFGDELTAKRTWFTVDDLKWVSKALLKSDLLTREKSAILKDFMLNKSVAQEVADVLNMRLASLESWHWPSEGVPMEMRRHLNGKYRMFMDEDLLDSLLFQYLGLKWAVTFRSAFVNFQGTRAWKNLREYIPKTERVRRQHFLGKERRYGISCVNDYRRDTYKTQYFMTQLPASVKSGTREYDDDNDFTDVVENKKNVLETKHSLLHLLITESIMHTRLHGQFTAIQSDFKYFGPSLPHTTMLTVLAYFGVPQNWHDFFRRFLECPLKFTQDGPDAAVQTRRRGIPMSHTLADCFGEAVLFCMDYAVNQSTDGAYLYRLHDDFWFWGQETTCVMGLEFNEEKTGTPYQGSSSSTEPGKPDASDSLPTGDIRWGFLKLDAEEGRFIIDQEQVDSHISELQRQLAACKSIFSWVQAWNSYFGRFFANNFAKPAMCFGRSHIDMAISTLSRIERTLFPDSPSGVTDHLRKTIAERFDIHDLPEGFFYFPVEFGGLELTNPYIPLLAMREDIKQTPSGRLQMAYTEDETEYHAAKERFDRNGPEEPASAEVFGDDEDPTAFLSLEEYTRHSETYSRNLLDAYKDLIGVPEELMINQSPKLRWNQMMLDRGISTRNVISDSWSSMSSYWKWTAELYQGEMLKRYGSLAAVNREFMPLGVVQTLKEGKFRWQG
ncbi:uncharacterized protein BDW43DRAFT_297724 [Aspergillus alliaceus]|uniref:uncharacterized protein n=1 Tax=Petromyces alliaceus TaxID=209559 RepID=UPI0012A3F03A|nr:cytochrome P450 [Aspergillus alliaceus]KAB8237406.1 cytochrome P450 [Aspergillus alliaceus]